VENRLPGDRRVERSFNPEERRRLEDDLRAAVTLTCPRCGVPLDRSDVEPKRSVSYVRRRVLLTCASCHGHAALDVDGRTG